MPYVVTALIASLALAAVVTTALARHVLYVVPEGEQHVVQRFGRFRTVRRPGVRFRFPQIERVAKLPDRPFAIPFGTTATTGDGTPLVVGGAIELRIEDAFRYVGGYHVVRRTGATIAAATVIQVVGARTAAELRDRSRLAREIARQLDAQLDRFGLQVAGAVITSVEPSPHPPTRRPVVAA